MCLSASVERFVVSRMRDFFNVNSVINFRRVTHFRLCLLETQVGGDGCGRDGCGGDGCGCDGFGLDGCGGNIIIPRQEAVCEAR